jgi:DoxX-like family
MEVFLWAVAGLLAAVFLTVGAAELALPKDRLARRLGGWAEDFPQPQIRVIGALEVLGAIGLIVPAALGVAPVLVPVAAVGLALMMIGALITHVRREDDVNVELGLINLILLVLAVALAYSRFGPFPFPT